MDVINAGHSRCGLQEASLCRYRPYWWSWCGNSQQRARRTRPTWWWYIQSCYANWASHRSLQFDFRPWCKKNCIAQTVLTEEWPLSNQHCSPCANSRISGTPPAAPISRVAVWLQERAWRCSPNTLIPWSRRRWAWNIYKRHRWSSLWL